MVRIWEAWLKEHPEAERLPAIVPLVVHHGPGGWTAARALEELLELDAEGLRALGEHVPRLRLLLDDLGAEDDAALKARAMSALGRLALLCLRHARTPEQLARGLGGWLDLVGEVRRRPNGAAALAAIWRYIFAINERLKANELLSLLVEAVGEDGKEELMSVADQLIEQGRKEGLTEGRKEGLYEGQRKALLKLLTARFGSLPEDAAARIQAASLAQLDLWFDRALTAPALSDVLGDA